MNVNGELLEKKDLLFNPNFREEIGLELSNTYWVLDLNVGLNLNGLGRFMSNDFIVTEFLFNSISEPSLLSDTVISNEIVITDIVTGEVVGSLWLNEEDLVSSSNQISFTLFMDVSKDEVPLNRVYKVETPLTYELASVECFFSLPENKGEVPSSLSAPAFSGSSSYTLEIGEVGFQYPDEFFDTMTCPSLTEENVRWLQVTSDEGACEITVNNLNGYPNVRIPWSIMDVYSFETEDSSFSLLPSEIASSSSHLCLLASIFNLNTKTTTKQYNNKVTTFETLSNTAGNKFWVTVSRIHSPTAICPEFIDSKSKTEAFSSHFECISSFL